MSDKDPKTTENEWLHLFFKFFKLYDFQQIALQGELRKLHEENGKLRSMLEQISKSYGQLQAQLLIALQKQKPQVFLLIFIYVRYIHFIVFFISDIHFIFFFFKSS